MEKGTVDGTVMPWAGINVFNLQEVTKYVTEINMFYFVYALVINNATWDKLPETAVKFIDENWMNLAVNCGVAWEAFCAAGRKIFLKSGGTILEFSAAERQEMDKRIAPIWHEWRDNLEAKGFPAKKQASDLYKILNTLGVKDPFIGYRP
jgi:TRAP-type C4-dicarboxylate transport system substrate-binding protein